MAWDADDDWDDEDDELDLRVEINVCEPFATAFRLSRTNLYDLLNNLANALRLPRTDFSTATNEYLQHLYRIIVDEFESGDADQGRAAEYAERALSYVEFEDLERLLRDTGWLHNLYVRQATLATFEDGLRSQFSRRMGSRIEPMLRRLGASGSPSARGSQPKSKRRRRPPRTAA